MFDYRDDPDGWLRYASLCRNAGNAALTESVLTRQLGFDPHSDATDETYDQRRLRYAYAKHCWRAGRESDALLRAEGLAEALAKEDDDDSRKLRARCLLRVGDWKLAQQDATPRQQRTPPTPFGPRRRWTVRLIKHGTRGRWRTIGPSNELLVEERTRRRYHGRRCARSWLLQLEGSLGLWLWVLEDGRLRAARSVEFAESVVSVWQAAGRGSAARS